jgi:hypothetical protein
MNELRLVVESRLFGLSSMLQIFVVNELRFVVESRLWSV